MYFGEDGEEFVSIVGTDAFMDFVEEIQHEGVLLEYRPMGEGTKGNKPLIIEVDHENTKKDIAALDIALPKLTPRVFREYGSVANLDLASFKFIPVPFKDLSKKDKIEIIFRDVATGSYNHSTDLQSGLDIDFRNVVSFFARNLVHELKLVDCYDVVYEKVKIFIADYLFEKKVFLDDPATMQNVAELEATKTIIEVFKREINALSVKERDADAIIEYSTIGQMRPFKSQSTESFLPKKSIFNKIVGDSHLELEFASFLDGCDDIISFAKNYLAINFCIDYAREDGFISNYYPDFIVKVDERHVVIVETKGLEDLDVPPKMHRLKQWCIDVNRLQKTVHYDYVFVDEESFHEYRPDSFAAVMSGFKKYKD